MKFLKWGGIALGTLVIVALGVGFLLPRTVQVERSIVIARPQATVYTVLSDWRQYNEWSPWAELDPKAEYTYEGAPGEPGSRMVWKGNEKAGSGSQEIVKAEPYERLVTEIAFGEGGGGGTATSTFTTLDVDSGTEVTWTFEYRTGAAPWARYQGLMARGFVGPAYEKGLEKLKTYVERMPDADFAGLKAEVMDVKPVPIAYITMRTAPDPDSVGAGYKEGYDTVWAFMQKNGLSPAGMPMGINTSSTDEEVVFDAALPIAGGVQNAGAGPVKIGATYGGKALRVIHIGAYAGLEETYEEIHAYMAAHRMKQNGRTWEHFVTDPGETPESELVTHIYVPLK